MTNGTGVYTDEDGFAGMGAGLVMITHFINVTSANGSQSVGFDGQWRDKSTGKWLNLQSGARIGSADFNGDTGYQVLSVSESGTKPTWVLSKNGSTTQVTGAELLKLRLYLYLTQDAGGNKSFTIAYNGGAVVQPTGQSQLAIWKFNMVWSNGSGSPFYQYCIDSSSAPDQVVFQQGIIVDPDTAAVTRDNSYVTLCCTKGAMAKVHSWGYAYRKGYKAAPLFDAGLQMKRDSYCADQSHYTVAGTDIYIDDSLGIQNDVFKNIEAYWSPQGALCVNMASLRHPELGFNGSCNGQTLPACDDPNFVPPTLSIDDGALSQNQP